MKAVIFDKDGVIVDSESGNMSSALGAFEKLGIKIKEEEKELIYGRHPNDYIGFFLEKYGFSYDDFKEIQRENYYRLLESAPLFNKTLSLIKELHNKNIRLALATSSALKSTLPVLKKANLESIFEVIVTFDDHKNRKPHPEPYLITAKKLDLEPRDCVVIEDSLVGLESAKKAGMKCVIILNDYTRHLDFSDADLIVNSPDEITLEVLKNL